MKKILSGLILAISIFSFATAMNGGRQRININGKWFDVVNGKVEVSQVMENFSGNRNRSESEVQGIVSYVKPDTWARILYLAEAVMLSFGQKRDDNNADVVSLKTVFEQVLNIDVVKKMDSLIDVLVKNITPDGNDQDFGYIMMVNQITTAVKSILEYNFKKNKTMSVKEVIKMLEIDKSYINLAKFNEIQKKKTELSKKVTDAIFGTNRVQLSQPTSGFTVQPSTSTQSPVQVSQQSPAISTSVTVQMNGQNPANVSGGTTIQIGGEFEEGIRNKFPNLALPLGVKKKMEDAWQEQCANLGEYAPSIDDYLDLLEQAAGDAGDTVQAYLMKNFRPDPVPVNETRRVDFWSGFKSLFGMKK